jgi:hypothetical protein
MEANSLNTSWTANFKWMDNVMKYIKSMEIANWKRCAQDRNIWKLFVEQAKTHVELKRPV